MAFRTEYAPPRANRTVEDLQKQADTAQRDVAKNVSDALSGKPNAPMTLLAIREVVRKTENFVKVATDELEADKKDLEALQNKYTGVERIMWLTSSRTEKNAHRDNVKQLADEVEGDREILGGHPLLQLRRDFYGKSAPMLDDAIRAKREELEGYVEAERAVYERGDVTVEEKQHFWVMKAGTRCELKELERAREAMAPVLESVDEPQG